MSIALKHAVVIGGSIGGLVAARVLSERFERVTVLDRDTLPNDPRARRGVPHGTHAHALLIGGRLALEKLFPGLTEELIAGGAVPFDPAADLLFVQMGAQRIRYESGMLGISMSRAFLEFSIRGRVSALANVGIRDGVAVQGVTGAGGRVTGVEIEDVGHLAADFVVDASGRGGGKGDRWLEGIGFPAPRIANVKIDVGYTTRLLHRSDGDLPEGGLLSLMAGAPPHDKTAGAAFPVEGDRWVVTIGGWHKDHAPGDPDGFAAFAKRLPAPHIADLIAGCEPIGDPEVRKFPTARRRYFERLDRHPAGYVALGDTICSFNPLYGQGMTVATLEAIELGRCFDRFGEPSEALTRAYYRAAAKVIATPWQMATGTDFMYPETAGPKQFGTDAVNWFARRALLATHVSVPVHKVLLDVQHLLAPPAALMGPATVVRSLLAARRSPARTNRNQPAPERGRS